jgi:hypothetical protein
VSAEDGTVKNYFIHAKRLSAKDATLSDLKLSSGTLSPEFSAEVLEYSCKCIPYTYRRWKFRRDKCVILCYTQKGK